MNIMMLLEMAAGAMSDRVVAGSRDTGLTHARLLTRAGVLAARLRSGEAQHLVICDEAGPGLLSALFGAAWAGVPYVPLNYRLTDRELQDLAARNAPALAITDHRTAARLAGTTGIETIDRAEVLAVAETGTAQPLAMGDWAMNPDEVAVLLYTSGTTGSPKTAVLRHRHLVSYVLGSVEFASAEANEAHLMTVPPYHIASVAALLSQVYAGRRVVFLPRFDPDDWIETVQREDISHAMVVPTMLARIIESLQRRHETITSLRHIAYGGGRTHQAVIERALELLPNTNFVNAYGLTEASSTVAVLGPEDHRLAASSSDRAVRSRLGSAGRPLPNLEVSIRDGHGNEVAVGSAGEIWIRGEQVAGEYREQGSLLDREGWFATRDTGRIDEGGYLYVLDRNDDVIIRGGENLSPGEIEDVLLTHPGVRDAAAVGLPSREWGEEVGVAVVAGHPRPGADELRELVRARLRSSRVPSHVDFVSELPYSETGKLLRRVVRDRFANPPIEAVDSSR